MDKRRVLVVDDSVTVRQQVASVLSQAGFEVIEAVDGQDGFDQLASRSGLAMVVCDINMPRMTGIELLEKLQATRRAAPPFLMLTTEGDPGLIQRARALGAKGWVVKPFKADLFVQAVRKLAA